MQNGEQQEDLLADEFYYVRASAGKRFLNYIVDIILFYVLVLGLGILIAIINPAAFEDVSDSGGFGLADRVLTLILYALYMSVVEALFKGKSLGKLITKTRAVNLDGSRISTGTAFARGFARAVPFCAFSAFGTPCDPWQDKWTNTIVIEEKG